MDTKKPDSVALKQLGIQCFNTTWDYIDKKDKTGQDLCEMINQAHASLWFWKASGLQTPTNISIGLWQISRVYALADDSDMAILFACRCIEVSSDPSVDPFYLAYGYEAAARGFLKSGRKAEAREYIEKAKSEIKKTKEKDVGGFTGDVSELESMVK